LNREYRAASQELRGFAKFPKRFSLEKKLAALESLESFDNHRNEFESDSNIKKILGPLFQGLETDWERVKTVYDWVNTAKKFGLDHRRVNTLLAARSELCGIASIQELKNEYQQVLSQCNSPNASLLGLTTVSVGVVRIADLEKRLESLKRLCTQTVEFSKALVQGDRSTVGAVREIYDACATYMDSQGALDSMRHTSDETLQAAVTAVCDQGEELLDAIQWMGELSAQVQAENLVDELDERGAEQVSKMLADAHQTCWSSIKQWDTLREEVVGQAEVQGDWLASTIGGVPRINLLQDLDRLQSEFDRLPGWLAFCRTYDRCRRAGVGTFAMAAATDDIPEAQLSNCYRLTLLNQIAEEELNSNEIGFHFTTQEMEDLRTNFQQLDRSRMQAKRAEIDQLARQRLIPEGNSRGRVSELTELALIKHEIGKKSRHCRIRDLMVRSGNALQALKPCFLMSPLSLARYIPSDSIEFDMVIMDEASQIKPEDAVGAILRAKQLIVVGDPKQLPPTSFFDQSEEELEDDEATQFDNAESILEVAQRSFQPYRRLRWHYRSQHERLIQFSNGKFYDEDLIVFPSPKDSWGGYGVVHHFVEGASCVKGENVKEAEAIVAAIVEHAKQHRSESLGVAAFNQKQTQLIDSLLDTACNQDADLAMRIAEMKEEEDGLFIKNLENIQGDERDVIFISYTYGPEPNSGRVYQRFGPINSELGWRRLNVMVTRARKRMEVFASMRPSDIQSGPDKSRGVNAYRDFLEFAESGKMREVGSESGREPGSPFEESVARVVESMGLEPVFQVGVAGYFIDIGVRRREGNREFLLGIECDGATYHSSRSARDRDRLREEIIKARGWNLHRIWSTEWFLNQQSEEARLQRVLGECLEHQALS